MIIIKTTPQSNGAYANQYSAVPFTPPDGWLVVPPQLEDAARRYLPFATLTVEDGEIVNIEDNPDNPDKPDPEPEPDPEPDYTEFIKGLMEGYTE